MTFDPHPSAVLGNRINMEYIMKKIKLIAELGIDKLFIVHFTPNLPGCCHKSSLINILV